MAIDATKALPALRLGVGVTALLAPGLAGKAFGLDLASNPQAAYLARLFGVRDIVLAAGVLAAPAGPARKLWWQLGVACDAADIFSAATETRAGRIPAFTGVSGGLVAAIATGLGVQAAQAEG